ncbi:TOMM system kinase/cyclase fusion protein [Pseudoalteromonas phenolica]|uniref:TOMM system kinase/cyclase fusion protein n=1 Tax=Pseudoalteromonas phenolica TaxID=161398 RepID=A0A4V2EK97_9GAMM|nr:TOMM system kinase/cyclase fusion protein [Pseudoalteromonas phenolica]RZQ55088.1 TOMM system kinase/cyclase fusion protein [Pseudoalteromonas phenolica]
MSLSQFSDQLIHEQFNSTQYQLLHKIGEGGFGKVFKATQINTGQTVAIKFLAIEPHCEEQQKQRYIERFKRETSLSSQLQHPNIVRLLDKGQVNDNLLYGVFEFVEGLSLREHLTQEGALNAVDAKEVMLQVLDALIHAHQNGIIHRDIKPANIMLSKTGAKTHAKILDFGIGTLTQDSRLPDFNTLTMTQETLGTPSYSAPEQLRGEPATTKTDLYVWGLVFLECLTGLPAISGSSVAAVYHKQLSDMQVSIPSSLLGHPIADLLRRILVKNATERVITGDALYQEVSQVNMSNLVGVLADYKVQQADDDTMVMRGDGPTGSSMQNYTAHIERKQITVLAIRLTSKIINNNDLDLDIVDTLFKSQRNHCIDIATRYGATHVGNLADSILFYFGYPLTSDNDTRLCARTILDAISDLAKRNALVQESHCVQINIHAGIHTGIFTTYANSMPEGHIANAAMSLAREAGERQVLCSAEARAILEPYSEFEHFGELQLGSTFYKEQVFNLNGERRVEAFGFMRGTRNNHELIGRNQELETTLSVIKKENTDSRLTHIHGEAGIGKSRLLQEIRANAAQYQHLVAQCLPEHQNNALYPILNLVRYLYNTTHLSSEKAITLFSEVLTQHDENIDLEQALPILLIWLNIELNEELTASTLAPDAQKALLFSSLTALLMSQKFSISEYKLYIVEDIHWADSTTLEFIQHFAAAIRTGDVLISTSRQKVPTQLQDLTLLEVNLKKLTEQATEDFIVKLFDEQAVSRNVLDVLINRTDGIPLFIEELVDMLKQKALVGVIDGEINFASPDKLEQVPSSLRESLQQKLDGLVHAKETAQLAATIGREFEYELLVAASSLSENQIQNDLNELIANDLIVQQRNVNSDSYIFKHALVRDAAYDSMETIVRKRTHKSIALLLRTQMQDSQYDLPFLIAIHFSKSDHFNEAIECILIAAKHAIRLSIEPVALKYCESAYNWNNHVFDKNRFQINELAISSIVIPSLIVGENYAPTRMNDISEKCKEIIDNRIERNLISDEENEYILTILWADFLWNNNRCSRNKTLKSIRRFEIFSSSTGLQTQSLFAKVLKGCFYWSTGEFSLCINLLEGATEELLTIQTDINTFITKYGLDAETYAYSILTLAYSAVGDTVSAQKAIDKAIDRSHLLNHAGNTSYAYTCATLFFSIVEDFDALKNVLKMNDELEKRHGTQFIGSVIVIAKDYIKKESKSSTSYLDGLLNAGIIHWNPLMETILMRILLDLEQYETISIRANSALALIDKSGESNYKPDILAKLAVAELKAGKIEQSKSLFDKAFLESKQSNNMFAQLECVVSFMNCFESDNEWSNRLNVILKSLPKNHKSGLYKKALVKTNEARRLK